MAERIALTLFQAEAFVCRGRALASAIGSTTTVASIEAARTHVQQVLRLASMRTVVPSAVPIGLSDAFADDTAGQTLGGRS